MLTTPIRTVVGIIQQNHKLLVALRPPHKPYSGYWEFPGGKVEVNESDEAALKRELHEELGIHVETAQFLFEHQHQYPDKTVLLEMWLVTAFTGEMQALEHTELRWVTMTDMQNLRLLEGNIAMLDKIKTLCL